ncbi:mevalonate kinase isoform X2 [Andrographis paniculata]|uniref:mevalonate kinase isoform X2 n=1 Tax=Andrographis paniculata TaxID=175694 RepID=UPI0021E8F839|nr:mevalonate kinase isoform X2 [Andrographis paniculata]
MRWFTDPPPSPLPLISTPTLRLLFLLRQPSSVYVVGAESDDELKLHLKDMDLEFSWPVGKIAVILSEVGGHDASTPSSCSFETIKAIASLVDEHNIPEAYIALASGVSAFLWLYTSIHGAKPARVVVTSELPLGSGLGSSASFCVALAGAFLALSKCVKLDVDNKGWQKFGDSELNLVNKWAFEGEKIIHGKPSGIDNTVSTYGNMIKFKSGELTRLKSNLPLKMLVTNTKVGRNTKALVAGVSERTFRHPNAMNSVFSAVDSISNELASILQSPVSDELAVTENEEKLAELMEMNQGLLQCMGVSHASIETVIRTTLKYKLVTKLTGAGGGGCVLTLLPSLLSGTIIDKLIAELESCGFQCLTAGIGGGGAEVSFGSS